MISFEFIEHKNVSPEFIDHIINLKDKVWHYPYSSHLEWIKNNLKDNDIHLLVWEDAKLIAYSNLININGSVRAWGIGNVVVHPLKQGMNVGLLLMNLCDYYLAKDNIPGLLICKDKVGGFYSKCGWLRYTNDVFIPDGSKLNYNLYTKRLNQSIYPEFKLDRIF